MRRLFAILALVLAAYAPAGAQQNVDVYGK